MNAAKTEYPARPKYFANRVIRQLVKTCAAQQIGHLGFAIVSTVAMTEDASGYRRAVTFYDAQLMMVLGVENQKQLAAARKKAVLAGWLNYRHGHMGVPGEYFVTIPEYVNLDDDTPSDEGYEQLGNNSGTTRERVGNDSVTTREQLAEKGTSREQVGNKSGTSREQPGNDVGSRLAPFLPMPVPMPSPEPVPKPSSTPKRAQNPVRSSTGEPVTWAEVAEGMKKLKVARIQDSIAAAQGNDFAPPAVLALIEHLQALPAGLAESPAGALVDRLRTDGAAEWLVDENWPWSAGKSETNPAAAEPYPIGKSSLPTADEERARNQASLRELDRLIQQHGDTLTAMSTEDLEEMILRSSLGTEKSREMILGLVRSKGRDSPIVHRNLLEMLDAR